MDVNILISFFHQFIYGMGSISDFMTTPIFFGLSPLFLLLPTGLIVYLGIAVTKWIIQ